MWLDTVDELAGWAVWRRCAERCGLAVHPAFVRFQSSLRGRVRVVSEELPDLITKSRTIYERDSAAEERDRGNCQMLWIWQ